MGVGEVLPWVGLSRLERKADPLLAQVDVEDLDVDLVADRHDRRRMVDVLPRQLGHVDEAVHPAEVDECAEVDDGRHHTTAPLAWLQVGEEVAALLALGLLEPCPARKDDVVAIAVELDDLRLDDATDVGLELTDPAELDQRGRQETTKPDVDDEATLHHLDDRALYDAFRFLDLLDGAPCALVLGALLGQDEPALFVLLLEHECFDVLSQRDDLVGVDVVADRKLANRDDALGLEADVEEDLVLVDLHDGSLDDVAVVELDDRRSDRVVERRPRKVVFGYRTR